MEHLCPQIERLLTCYSCSAQSLPPYRLCLDGHVGCSPCATYLPLCPCGHRYAVGPHLAFDWVVMAMKLRCKYRRTSVAQTADERETTDYAGGDLDDCDIRWYDIQELHEHYKTGCSRNAFKCPLDNCRCVARVETVVEHYETVHGPFVSLTSGNGKTDEVTFRINPSALQTEIIKKIFNGYFMIVVKQQPRRKTRDPNPQVSIQNINPSDPLRYEYIVMMTSSKKEITITVSIMETMSRS